MIDNNTDRMSVNSSIYLDRIVKLEDQFVDDLLHHLPDQPGSGSVVCVRCVRTIPGFSKSIFSSQITGNEVLISYRTSDVIGRLD
jgi:hypothetical protein